MGADHDQKYICSIFLPLWRNKGRQYSDRRFCIALGQFVPKCHLPPERAVFLMPGKPRRNGGLYGIFRIRYHYFADLFIALDAGLGVWGVVNLLEGYSFDNPGSNAHVR